MNSDRRRASLSTTKSSNALVRSAEASTELAGSASTSVTPPKSVLVFDVSIPEDRMVLYWNTFVSFDRNRSMTIPVAEFTSALRDAGFLVKQLEGMETVREYNLSDSARVSFQEFIQICESLRLRGNPTENPDNLDAFIGMGGNADRTGYVDIEKLRDVLTIFQLREDVFNSWVKRVDPKNSGKLDYQSFCQLLSS